MRSIFFVTLFLLLGNLLRAQQQGQALIDSLLTALPKAVQDTDKVHILCDLSFAYNNIDPDKGISYGEQGLQLAEKIKWKYGIAFANSTMGVCYWSKSDFPRALEYHFNALKINEEIGNKKSIAKNYGNIGLVYWSQSDYVKAKEYYFKALRLCEELQYKIGTAYNNGNIGLVYMDEKKYPQALEYELKALQVFEEVGNKYEIARFLGNIGVVYSLLLNNEKALEYYFRALSMNRELGIKNSTAKNLGNIGGRYLDLASDSNHALLNKLFNGDKKLALTQAKLYLDSAAVIKEDIKDLNSLKETFKSLSRTEELLGEERLALEYYKKYSETKDSVFNSENDKKITKLQMQYEFDKKEAAANAKTEKQALIRNYIFSGMGMIVLFLVVLLFQRNRIAKERRKIALEQERMRISRDLHDDLGSGLTGILMISEQLHASSSKDLVNSNIEKIKISSRQMVDQMGEIVWAMNSKNDTLENLVGYLNTFARDYFENYPIALHIEMPEIIPLATMSGMMRRNIFLVLKESMNNIVKHAAATEVNLKIDTTSNRITIVLTDNGKGFTVGETRRFGNGLKNMQSRMQDIKGNYTIESSGGKGTKTILGCPLS